MKSYYECCITKLPTTNSLTHRLSLHGLTDHQLPIINILTSFNWSTDHRPPVKFFSVNISFWEDFFHYSVPSIKRTNYRWSLFSTFVALACICKFPLFQLGARLEVLFEHSNCSLFITLFFKQYPLNFLWSWVYFYLIFF